MRAKRRPTGLGQDLGERSPTDAGQQAPRPCLHASGTGGGDRLIVRSFHRNACLTAACGETPTARVVAAAKRTAAPLRTPPERRKPNSFELAGLDHIISGLSS